MFTAIKKHSAISLFRLLALAALCCVFSALFLIRPAAAANIQNLRIGQGIGNVRVVFDADSSFEYKVFLLNSPKRLVVDAQNVKVNAIIEKVRDKNNLLANPRIGVTDSGAARIAFDLKKPVVVKKAFMLPPQSSFGWRFVVDLEVAAEREFTAKVGNQFALANGDLTIRPSSKATRVEKARNDNRSNSKKIIVLDPGHGGQDPGAIGCSGVYEKNITLAMARELKKILEKDGYKVYLTRNRDIFIPLRERVRIARNYKADLFLSIHADSALNKNAKGLSVYTLSETASDKEAAALAERENKADVIAGLNFAEHSKEVSDILINLAQRETMNRSSEFANFMVQEMRKSVKLVDNTHRFAGFAVLKAPDVPAALLEMGYLSNRTEEKLLRQEDYRRKLAKSASAAIDSYFENMRHASLF